MLSGKHGGDMAERVVKWNRFLLPLLGLAGGLGGAMGGLSKGLTVWLIIGACTVLLAGEYVLLRSKGDADA